MTSTDHAAGAGPAAGTPPAESFAQGFTGNLGATGVLGLTLVTNEDGLVRMRIAYRDELARSHAQPALHAGAIITAIDSTMGMTGMQYIQRVTGAMSGIATLDFRYDEFSAPATREDVLIESRCERMHNDILYITGACTSLDGTAVHGRATGRFIRTPHSSMPPGAGGDVFATRFGKPTGGA